MKRLLLLLLLTACATTPPTVTYRQPGLDTQVVYRPLDARWKPLIGIVQDKTRAPGWVYTKTPFIYAQDPDDLLDRTEAVTRDALLTHERLHAQHQTDYGPNFYSRYANDQAFRRAEELEAWSAQIAYHKAHGELVDPHWVATALTNPAHYNLGWDFPTALAWAANEVSK